MATESTTPTESEAAAAPHPDAIEGVQKPPSEQRSWRRKYRKMRVKFDETMNASNTLIKEEYKAMAVAARLQEQNDQILEALLDLNDSARLPANLRFDLRELADTHAETGPETLQRKLHELRTDMVNGVITPEEFARKSDQIHTTQPIIPSRTLSSLEATVPHSTQIPDPPPEGLLLGEHAPGYMDSLHEDEYLLALDTALSDPTVYDPDAHDGRPLRIPPSRPIPTEKELSIQNPDSVYNWLRKNRPQVFLQDKDHQHPENVSEKSAARQGGSSGKSKRASGVSAATPGPKNDPDMLDDELGFIPETGTAKGRRSKQEDDQAYRPKGGSSRGSKRKREDGDPVHKGGRKKRASNISAAGA